MMKQYTNKHTKQTWSKNRKGRKKEKEKKKLEKKKQQRQKKKINKCKCVIPHAVINEPARKKKT